MKARIVMKIYMVVKYYLENLSFEFHEDSCINARARLISVWGFQYKLQSKVAVVLMLLDISSESVQHQENVKAVEGQ